MAPQQLPWLLLPSLFQAQHVNLTPRYILSVRCLAMLFLEAIRFNQWAISILYTLLTDLILKLIACSPGFWGVCPTPHPLDKISLDFTRWHFYLRTAVQVIHLTDHWIKGWQGCRVLWRSQLMFPSGPRDHRAILSTGWSKAPPSKGVLQVCWTSCSQLLRPDGILNVLTWPIWEHKRSN